jgi:hypothetical protein
MTDLIDILTEETKSLRLQYLEMTKEWSLKHFDFIMKKSSWKEEDWCKYFNIQPVLKNPTSPTISFMGFPNGFYNSHHSKTYRNLKNEIYLLNNIGKDAYLAKQNKIAELHYENSIQKLAFRIEKKGLDITKLKVKTSHVGINIDTFLTDGIKTVKAFTIIAQGEIQKPHYRYLIK